MREKYMFRTLSRAAALAAVGTAGLAQELSIFALEGAGQATVAIDNGRRTAYVVDLGKDGDGDQVRLEGEPLLDRLSAKGVEKLIVTCSHPHADHHGGIRAVFRNPRNFITPTGPRFAEGIFVAESAVPPANSLLTLLNTKGAAVGVKGQKIDPSLPSAYSAHSTAADAVFVESVRYTAAPGGGVHGRSIITKTVLGGKHIHIDFDDADSRAIASAVGKLKESGITAIDSFVVPHHGSAEHSLAPIYSLTPKQAIISVNPANRYGHPAPEILEELLTRLPPENVIFTGSIPGERVVIKPEGVEHAPHTAASADTLALFVRPAMARAKGGRTASAKAAYEKIVALMSGRREANNAASAIGSTIKANGTMLSEDFEAGAAAFGHVKPDQVAQMRIFPSEGEGGDLGLAAPRGPGPPGGPSRPSGRRISQTRHQVDPNARISVIQLNDFGLPDMAQAPKSYSVNDLLPSSSKARSATPGNKRPEGGMVNLTGDKLMMTEDAKALQAGRIKKCGPALCLVTNNAVYGSEKPLRLPFPLNTLTAAVWRRTYRDGVDRLYLSINPTKRMLDRGSMADAEIPGDRLYYGATLKSEWRNNRVVTMGDIDQSLIGKILWEADVAFKSESLGFDVLTGRRPAVAVPNDIATDLDERAASANLRLAGEVERPARWCRMYWESGEQRIKIDWALGQIRLGGKAVVARGEAMRLLNGELLPYPEGPWCEHSKAVAARLEAAANAAVPASQNLRDLRDLAALQNFWRWAREHLITVDDDLVSSLTALAEKDAQQNVPAWTSGVRSSEPVLVQYRRTTSSFLQSQMLHLRFSDRQTLDKCVLPKWSRADQELGAQGVTRDPLSGRYTGRRGVNTSAITNAWMRDFGDEIAACSQGRKLPERIITRTRNLLSDDDDEPSEGEFGVTPHLQPIAVHGGVVLGKGSETLPETVSNSKTLNDSWGRPLYRSQDGALHFWVTNNEPGKATLLQHLVIPEGVLKEVFAKEGRVRFLVETKPGGFLRQEARLLRPSKPNQGLEWFGIYDGQSATAVMEKAASSCPQGAAACNPVANMPKADLENDPAFDEESGLRLIDAISAGGGAWVIELPVDYVANSLAKLLTPSGESDIGRSASLARAYRYWGFEDRAIDQEETVQEAMREKTGTEDPFLGERETTQMFRVMLVQFKLLRMVLELTGKSAAVRLSELASLERSIGQLPLADAYEFLEMVAELCDETKIPDEGTELSSRKETLGKRLRQRLELSKLLFLGRE